MTTETNKVKRTMRWLQAYAALMTTGTTSTRPTES